MIARILGCGIMAVESWLWNHCCEILASEASGSICGAFGDLYGGDLRPQQKLEAPLRTQNLGLEVQILGLKAQILDLVPNPRFGSPDPGFGSPDPGFDIISKSFRNKLISNPGFGFPGWGSGPGPGA